MNKIKGNYLHCRHCIASKIPSDIEVLSDSQVLQLWCRVHDVQIAKFYLKNRLDVDRE